MGENRWTPFPRKGRLGKIRIPLESKNTKLCTFCVFTLFISKLSCVTMKSESSFCLKSVSSLWLFFTHYLLLLLLQSCKSKKWWENNVGGEENILVKKVNLDTKWKFKFPSQKNARGGQRKRLFCHVMQP